MKLELRNMLPLEVLSRLAMPPLSKDPEELSNLNPVQLLELLNEIFLYFVPGYKLENHQVTLSLDDVTDRMLLYGSHFMSFSNVPTDTLKKGLKSLNKEIISEFLCSFVKGSSLFDGRTLCEVDATLLRELDVEELKHLDILEALSIGKKIEKHTKQKVGSPSEAKDLLLLGTRSEATISEAPVRNEQTRSWPFSILSQYLRQKPYQETTSIPENATVKGFDWHPTASLLGIIHIDDTLNIFNPMNGVYERTRISHEFQRGVNCISWSPSGRNVIAVGCKAGVCLWMRDYSWMQYLRFLNGLIVTTISWSPDGRFLAVGSRFSTDMMIVEISTQKKVIIPSYLSGVEYLEWSSNGHFLLTVCSSSNCFRIWETLCWSSELWADFPGYVESATFHPCGRTITVATRTISKSNEVFRALYNIEILKSPPSIGGELSESTLSLSGDSDNLISQVVWDPTGLRLAICYKQSASVELYSVQGYPNIKFALVGEIHGPNATHAYSVKFKPKYKKGALLTGLFYASYKVQTIMNFVPLDFKP